MIGPLMNIYDYLCDKKVKDILNSRQEKTYVKPGKENKYAAWFEEVDGVMYKESEKCTF